MALTREFLKGLGVGGMTDEIMQSIVDEHGATVTTNQKNADEALKQLRKQRDARPDISAEELTRLKSDLASATQSLETFKGVDVAALQEELSSAKEELGALKAQSEQTVAELQADMLLRERLAPLSFSSDYARHGVYSDLKGKVSYEPGEGGALGALSGFDEALAELRESKPAAFAADAPPPKAKATGRHHKPGGDKEEDDFAKGFNS